MVFPSHLRNGKSSNPGILQHSVQFIRHIRPKFGFPNSSQSPDIRQNSDGCIYDFLISGQSLIKENCYNSRTGDDIDMNLELVIKLDKRNKTTSKKFGDDVMSRNDNVIVFF